MRKVPIVAAPLSLRDVFCAAGRDPVRSFAESLRTFLGVRHVFVFDSATASLLVLLRSLGDLQRKNEVIIPAYTASSVVWAVRQAGLRPVLCDMKPEDFGMDYERASSLISAKTLGVIDVHLFGFVSSGSKTFSACAADTVVIEDCAQSLGSAVNGSRRPRGAAAIYSFNRGKNLSVYGGGCIATDDDALAGRISKAGPDKKPAVSSWSVLARLAALYLAGDPWLYGALYPLVKTLKGEWKESDVRVKAMHPWQAGVAACMLEREEAVAVTRMAHARAVCEALKGFEGVIVPALSDTDTYAFNRLPLLIKDPARRIRIEEALAGQGIETSRMYDKPMHHLFELGYGAGEFPGAIYLAEHLLTLPVHPLVRLRDIERMIACLAAVVKG